MLLTGCKTTEQKLMEETLAFNEEVYQVLSDNTDSPDKAIEALTQLEEETRDSRRRLKTDFKAALEALDDAKRKAFEEEAQARYKELAVKFQTIVKRYPPERQGRIRQLVGVITH